MSLFLALLQVFQMGPAPDPNTEKLRPLVRHTAEFLAPRFRPEAPCPDAPPVMIDQFMTGVGLAAEMAKAHQWQARMLWIDATANIDRYNTTEKIDALTSKIAESGFNTVVFDIKPISGQTVYPSAFAPKLTSWRNQELPKDFDPVPPMIEGCHRHHLSILVSMNAFSEGHRLFKVGPGYDQPDHQSLLYKPIPYVKAHGQTWPLSGETRLEATTSLPAKTQGDTLAAAIAEDGHVDNLIDLSNPNRPKTPQGDTFLVGSKDAAKYIKVNLTPGSHADFVTETTYVRMQDLPGAQIPLMMDPNDSEVRRHALQMIEEVAHKYPVDGLIYDDRLRYAGIDGDFSESSRTGFEAFVGHTLTWPDDVFRFTIDRRLHQGIQPGKYYDAWLAWRAARIKDFVADVAHVAHQNKKQFGVYAGSWYGDYPALGHNYASDQATAGFSFLTPTYQSAGTANLLDFLIVGCYYQTATMYDAMVKGDGIGATVEGAGTLCNRLARGETWTYAGIDCEPFAHDSARLADAVQAACASTQGVMVFDLSHDMDDLWPTFAKIFHHPRLAPHQVPGALAKLRNMTAQYDRYGTAHKPIVIAAGGTGTGQ